MFKLTSSHCTMENKKKNLCANLLCCIVGADRDECWAKKLKNEIFRFFFNESFERNNFIYYLFLIFFVFLLMVAPKKFQSNLDLPRLNE